MPRYRTPESLVCVGGAGREIGKTFLKQKWILEEILLDDPRDDAPDAEQNSFKSGIQGFFIDTDTSSSGSFLSDIEDLETEIKNEHDITAGPDIKTEYINIVDEVNRDLDANAFLHKTTVQDVLAHNNSKAWWLADSQDVGRTAMLDQFENFSDGVERRRGLTKAVYQMGYADTDPLSSVVDSVGGKNTAMVVGLGGGTGSGLFIDLAHRMRSEYSPTITLFAVLPDPDFFDNEGELANAYAALAELEYLALNDQNLFENIILLPFRPANSHDVFDKAATYAITSFYNIRESPANIYQDFNEEVDVGPPKFAPFTIAVPRYLEYLKEDVDITEENFQVYIEDKEQAQTSEADLYDEVGSYIKNNYQELQDGLFSSSGNPTGNIRLNDSQARDLLVNRLRPLRTLVEQDFLVEIDYDSGAEAAEILDGLEEEIRQGIDIPEGGDEAAFVAREMFERIHTAINSIEDIRPRQGFVAGEEEFAELVIEEIELIARRAQLLRVVDQIKDRDENIGDDIARALNPEIEGYTATVEDEVDNITTDIENIEKQIQDLEDTVSQVESERKSLLESWESNVSSDIKTLYKIDTNKSEIKELLTELEDAIDNIIATAKHANDPTELEFLTGGPDFDEYERLNNLLSKIGANELSKESINNSVDAMINARISQLKAQQQSTGSEVLSKFGIGRNKADYYDDYRQDRIQNIDSSVLTISEPSEKFSVTVQSDLFSDRRQYLEDAREEAVSHILTAADNVSNRASQMSLDDLLDSPPQGIKLDNGTSDGQFESQIELSNQLDSESEPNPIANCNQPTDLKQYFRDGLIKELINEALLGPVQSELTQKNQELESLETKLEYYQSAMDLVYNEGQTFANRMDSVDAVDDIPVYEDPSEPGPFRHEKMPENRGAIGGADDLGDTQLWEEDGLGERNIIEKDLAELMDLNFGSEHIGLESSQPSLDVGRDGGDLYHRQYEGHRAHTICMSPLFDDFKEDESALLEGVTEVLTDRSTPFTVGDNYQATRGRFADDWDITATTYIGGVFLDNLNIFTDECRSAYTEFADFDDNADGRHNPQDLVPGTVMRHTYGIDGTIYHDEEDFIPSTKDGAFVWRKDILNFDRTEDIKVLFDQEPDRERNDRLVAESLLNNFYEIVSYPSTIPTKD